MQHCEIKIRGFFLPVFLLLMQAILLLTIWSLQSESLNAKTVKLAWQKDQFDNDLDQIMKVIAQDLGGSCVIQSIPVETIQQSPFSWWQSQTCSGNFHTIEYHYVVEALGEDPCAYVENTPLDVADYYRISLFGIDNQNGFKVLLQSSYVKAVDAHEKCLLHRHEVKTGPQSWQKLE